jgi:hypothetical protein
VYNLVNLSGLKGAVGLLFEYRGGFVVIGVDLFVLVVLVVAHNGWLFCDLG